MILILPHNNGVVISFGRLVTLGDLIICWLSIFHAVLNHDHYTARE